MNRLGKIRLLKCPKLLNRDLTGQEVHCLLAFQPISKVGFEIGKALRRWSEVGLEKEKSKPQNYLISIIILSCYTNNSNSQKIHCFW